jgi:hypothetical protein
VALVSGFAYAQDDVTVAGRVLDSATGRPVPFATVTVLRDGAAVGGELADEDGRFVLERLERGSYTVSIGFVGSVAAESPLSTRSAAVLGAPQRGRHVGHEDQQPAEAANGIEAQMSVVYYAEKPIAQGREAVRSSVDLGFKKPVLRDAELVVSVTDLFHEFGIRQYIDGEGFDAVYENFYETQTATVDVNYRF